ncbi:hypothetical protein [Bradyrhizobium cenepequi]
MKRTALQAVVASFIVALIIPAVARAGERLITEEEAKLPPPKGAVAADRRGILRGPKIEFISPGEEAHSPIHLKLKFEAYGGAKIETESVRMMYLRTPNVDLTPRVKQYLQPAGIDMPGAELPPGEYMVRIDLKDSDGRPGSASFVLKVAP